MKNLVYRMKNSACLEAEEYTVFIKLMEVQTEFNVISMPSEISSALKGI